MSSYNNATVVGRLGQDPEVRYMPNGTAVANLTVATSEKWKDKQTQEWKEETEWHRVVLYGKLAEVAGEYLRKGSQVLVTGPLKTRKWQDSQGVERYTTEIKADTMKMMGSAQAGGNGGQGGGQQQQQQQQRSQQNQQQSQPQGQRHQPQNDPDDIPF